MSDSISLSVDYTTSNRKTASRTITNVSASATDSELNSFVTDLYGLTTNSVGTVMRIAKRELSDEPDVPTTNPIQSIAKGYDAPSGLYTISGTGTNRTVAVNEAILATFIASDDSATAGGIEITLQNNFTPTVYAGKFKIIPTVNTNDFMINLGIAVAVEGNRISLFACTPCVGLTDANCVEGNVTVQFDSVTVDGVKYSPWSVTFTLAE